MDIIQTKRLLLRPFELSDASALKEIMSDFPTIAETAIPYPYIEGYAEKWIEEQLKLMQEGVGMTFGITIDAILIGSVRLEIEPKHQRAKLDYFLAKDKWGQGYATESCFAVLGYAFNHLNIIRIFAGHIKHNEASGRVLKKIGMKQEGILRHHVVHSGIPYDVICYSILKEEYPIT